MKDFIIAQEYVMHGVHYYVVKAETMGEAVKQIEEDPTLLPDDTEVQSIKIVSYTEADDNYDS